MPSAFSAQVNKNLVIRQANLLPPTSPSATADSDTEITIDWTDSVTNKGEVRVERSLASGSGFVEIATVALGAETYQDTGLTAATQYFYRLRAFYLPLGYSVYTSTVNATTDA